MPFWSNYTERVALKSYLQRLESTFCHNTAPYVWLQEQSQPTTRDTRFSTIRSTIWTKLPQAETTPLMSLPEPSGTKKIFLRLASLKTLCLFSGHSFYELNIELNERMIYLVCVWKGVQIVGSASHTASHIESRWKSRKICFAYFTKVI